MRKLLECAALSPVGPCTWVKPWVVGEGAGDGEAQAQGGELGGKSGAGPGLGHSSTHAALPTRAPPSHWLGSAAGPASASSRVLWLAAPPGGESVLLLASSLLPLSSAKLLRWNGIGMGN